MNLVTQFIDDIIQYPYFILSVLYYNLCPTNPPSLLHHPPKLKLFSKYGKYKIHYKCRKIKNRSKHLELLVHSSANPAPTNPTNQNNQLHQHDQPDIFDNLQNLLVNPENNLCNKDNKDCAENEKLDDLLLFSQFFKQSNPNVQVHYSESD